MSSKLKAPSTLNRLSEDKLEEYAESIGVEDADVAGSREELMDLITAKHSELRSTDSGDGEPDQTPISEMSKDELYAHAKLISGGAVEINLRDDIAALRDEVQAMEDLYANPAEDEPEAIALPESTHLMNPKTKAVFVRSKALVKRGDLVACDCDGNRA